MRLTIKLDNSLFSNLSMLSLEQMGLLFKMIIEHQVNGHIIDTEDLAVKMAFNFIVSSNNKKVAKSSAPALNIGFNYKKGIFTNIDDDFFEYLEFSYPAVDAELELRAAACWLYSNPTKKKSNYKRFITNWFKKCQDKGGNKNVSRPYKAY